MEEFSHNCVHASYVTSLYIIHQTCELTFTQMFAYSYVLTHLHQTYRTTQLCIQDGNRTSNTIMHNVNLSTSILRLSPATSSHSVLRRDGEKCYSFN